MTCVYICGLHLNNDSLRVGEEGVEPQGVGGGAEVDIGGERGRGDTWVWEM